MQKTFNIAVVAGDGIGPEVCESAIQVLKACKNPGCELAFQYHKGGAKVFLETGTALPDATLEQCLGSDAVLHGAAGLPDVNFPDGTEAGQDFSMKMRSTLDLYANIRPVRSFPGVPSPLQSPMGRIIDYIIVRENTEGLYAARSGGNIIRNEVATDTMIFTRFGIERICHKAAELALSRNGAPADGVKRITIVDKANVLRGYAFFRKVALEVFAGYKELEVECILIDAVTADMLQRPEHFDIIVTENMFGDIISDLAAATVGGLGIAPSAEIGDQHGYFQGIHGSAPTLTGKNLANPIATILSAAEMLSWLGRKHNIPSLLADATRISDSVTQILAEAQHVTADLGGTASTTDCTNAIIQKMNNTVVQPA